MDVFGLGANSFSGGLAQSLSAVFQQTDPYDESEMTGYIS